LLREVRLVAEMLTRLGVFYPHDCRGDCARYDWIAGPIFAVVVLLVLAGYFYVKWRMRR
jgi:hypothetical protein